jgi:hypothetical protein
LRKLKAIDEHVFEIERCLKIIIRAEVATGSE